MVRQRTRRTSGEQTRSSPVGWGGLDEFTNAHMLDENRLRKAKNVRLEDRSVKRRDGSRKLVATTDRGASITFGTDAKYASVPTAAQLLLPAGGFAVRMSFKVVWPGASDTGYLVSSRITGQAYHVFSVTMSDAGVLIVAWTKASDNSLVSITTSALTANSDQHLLAVFDAPAGTFTLYLNGVSVGTPVTGIAVTEKPHQAADDWYFGVHWNPSAGPAAAVADTHYAGLMDGFTLLTLTGTRPSSGSPTLNNELIRQSLQQWPLPQSRMVVASYDFNEATGTTLIDHSRFKNDGTLAGTPTLGGTAVALPCVAGQHVGHFEKADGKRTNLVATAGTLYYETVRAATP